MKLLYLEHIHKHEQKHDYLQSMVAHCEESESLFIHGIHSVGVPQSYERSEDICDVNDSEEAGEATEDET